jgi:hypothetical protein
VGVAYLLTEISRSVSKRSRAIFSKVAPYSGKIFSGKILDPEPVLAAKFRPEYAGRLAAINRARFWLLAYYGEDPYEYT